MISLQKYMRKNLREFGNDIHLMFTQYDQQTSNIAMIYRHEIKRYIFPGSSFKSLYNLCYIFQINKKSIKIIQLLL